MRRVLPFRRAAWLAAALATACANHTVDGVDVGSGAYLQLLSSGRVILERDFSGSGFRPCVSQAALLVRSTPALQGKVRCAPKPSDDPLPYSFTTHVQKTESDDTYPTAPFVTRTATARLCATWRDNAKAREKTVVTAQACGDQAPGRT